MLLLRLTGLLEVQPVIQQIYYSKLNLSDGAGHTPNSRTHGVLIGGRLLRLLVGEVNNRVHLEGILNVEERVESRVHFD